MGAQMNVLEYKDIEVVIIKVFTIKSALGDDGWARIPFKSLPYPKGFPQILMTPFVKVMNDRYFEEAVNGYLKEQGREGAVERRS